MRKIGIGPFDSSQTAISLFVKSPCVYDSEKETDVDDRSGENLANDDDDEYKHGRILQLDHYKEIDKDIKYLPQGSEFEKEICVYGCQEAEVVTINGLESRTKDMDNPLLEYLNIQEELSHVLDETSASNEREFEFVNDEWLKCIKRAQVAESTLSLEKPRTEELKEKLNLVAIANQAEKRKEDVESMQVEAEVSDKSLLIDSLQSRLHRANELHSCVEKLAFDAISEANVLKAELDLKEAKKLDQECYIHQLETEAEGLKMELLKANEESKALAKSLEETKKELERTRKRVTEENEAEIEIALLKSELHKGRSRLAAASASEERAKVEKSAINIALHHLAAEALKARTENNRLKEDMKKTSEDSSKTNVEGNDDKVDFNVMISREEYELLLIKNAELANTVQKMMDQEDYKAESEKLKKELQIANEKITELRSRAEQAISRAEAAEKVKDTLEERVKRWKEQRAKKKASTLSTLHVESMNLIEEDGSLRYKSGPKVQQTLGKILNMKL